MGIFAQSNDVLGLLDTLQEAVETLTPPIFLGEIGADEEDYHHIVEILVTSKEFDLASFRRLFAYVASEYMYWEGDKESRFWEGLQKRIGRSLGEYSQIELYRYLDKGLDDLLAIPGPDVGTHRHVARCAMQSYLQRSRVNALSELVDRLRFQHFVADKDLIDAISNHWIFQLRLTSLKHLPDVDTKSFLTFFRTLISGKSYPAAYFRNDSLFISEYESGGSVWGQRVKREDRSDIEIRRDQSGRIAVFVPKGFQTRAPSREVTGSSFKTDPDGGSFRAIRGALEADRSFSFRLTRHGPDRFKVLTSPGLSVELPNLSLLPAFLLDLEGYLVAPGRPFPANGGTLYCAPDSVVEGFEEASTSPALSGFETYHAVDGRANNAVVKATLGKAEVKWYAKGASKRVEIKGIEEIAQGEHVARKSGVCIAVPEEIGPVLRLLIREIGENGMEQTVYEGEVTVSDALVSLEQLGLKKAGSYSIQASRADGRRLLSRRIHFAPGLYIQKENATLPDLFAYVFVSGDGLISAAIQGQEPDKSITYKGFRVAVSPNVSEATLSLNYGGTGTVRVPIDVPRIDAKVFVRDAEFPIQSSFPIEALDHEGLTLRIRGPVGAAVRLEIHRKRDDILVALVEKQIPAVGELEESTRILFKDIFDRLLEVNEETRLWVRIGAQKLPKPIMELTTTLPTAKAVEILYVDNVGYINLCQCSTIPLGCLSLRIGKDKEEALDISGPPHGSNLKVELPLGKIPENKKPISLALIVRGMRAERTLHEWVFEA